MAGKVTVFTLGGTISAAGGGDTARLSGAQVLSAVTPSPGLEVDLHEFRRLPSSTLAMGDVAELAGLIDAVGAAGSGAVVVQGTDTIEESAFLLDLLCAHHQPIVVTGAMRRPDAPGSDGAANLAAALAVAGDPGCQGLGVLVVLADEIHAARHARKTHTTSISAFASPGAGPLGFVVEGRPHVLTRPATTLVERPLRLRRPVRVALVMLSLGDRGELLESVDERFDGLVVAAFGAGHVPEWWVSPLERLTARMPVVLASRTGAGAILSHTYRGPGSEHDLLSRGMISAGPLDAPKTRILLHALLSDGASHTDIRRTFAHIAM